MFCIITTRNQPMQYKSDCGEPKPTNTEYLEALKDDPASIRSFQDFISHTDPETLSAISGGKVEGISPDTVKTTSKVVSRMSPEELQRMFQLASFFPRENSFSKSGSSFSPGSNPPDLSPTATDMMSKFSPEELQKMFEMTSSLKGNEAASSSSLGFHTSPGLDPPNVTPNMLKMATDMMGKMSPKEHFKRV
ncbi:hypothetical protein Pfo_007454 [Paulownia fortunei]|nr:hypothetical protein Pfo_007454 [Paulownia fortunei]